MVDPSQFSGLRIGTATMYVGSYLDFVLFPRSNPHRLARIKKAQYADKRQSLKDCNSIK